MNRFKILFFALFMLLLSMLSIFWMKNSSKDDLILSYVVNPKKQNLQLYWKDDLGKNLKTFKNLENFVSAQNAKLIFATNGGMFNPDFSPTGLFIQNGKILSPLNSSKGDGNFYLQPNGIFYLTNDRKAFIERTLDFKQDKKISFATQSGPMLLIDGQINTAFKNGSENMTIRNGVGILTDNKILFAMSKSPINLYDFSRFFKNAGCTNALYLDGFVSRTYFPEKKWTKTDGDFGVFIGIIEVKK